LFGYCTDVATDPYEYAAGLNPGNRHDTVRLHVLGEHLDAVAADGRRTGVVVLTLADPPSLRSPPDTFLDERLCAPAHR